MKPAVLNLTGKTVDKNVTSLLNLGSNFVPTPKSIPYMKIITAIESQALKLESSKKDASAENLPQIVSKILSMTIGKKQDNLRKAQRKALKQLKNDKQVKVYPFDKDIGFALLNDIDSRVFSQKSVLKICSKIYRRTMTWKYDFDKVAKQLYWNHTSPWAFFCNFAAYFQKTLSQEHLWEAAS